MLGPEPQAVASTQSTPLVATELLQLREDIRQLGTRLDQTRRDTWDRLAAFSPLIGGVLVALIGGVATYVFNRRQEAAEDARNSHELAIQRVQTLRAFMPELRSDDEPSKEAAILAITSLGDSELMSRVADLFKGRGVATALAKIASGHGEAASFALESLTDLMAVLQPAVVIVDSSANGTQVIQASGFVAAPGRVVTVSYVLGSELDSTAAEGRKVHVRFPDGRSEEASVLAIDAESTLAALATETLDVAPLPLEVDPAYVEAGAPVIVLGYARGATAEVSVGQILGWADAKAGSARALIRADINTLPGFSGAPVVDPAGKVVGISHAQSVGGDAKLLIPAAAVSAVLHQSGAVPD
jgi:hypothetical protein